MIYQQYLSSGGLEKYLVGLSRALIGRGHDLDVVTAETDPVTRAMPVRLHMMKRVRLSSALRLWDFAWRSNTYCRDQLKHGKGIDLTIGFGRTVAHDLHRAGGGCHAVYSRLLPPAKRFGFKNRLELSLEGQLYTSGKTRHFVLNSSKVREEVQREYGIDPERCSVVHTAVDTEQFRPTESEDERFALRKRLGMPSGCRIILFVSSSHRRKGLGTLVDALAEASGLDDVEIWIAGKPLDSHHRQRVRAVPGLLPRIKSLGHRSDLPELYRAADLFVHPTLYDACANTVLQAMASGIPGIVSSADGAAEFIQDRENGYVLENPADSTELRHCLEAGLCLDTERRRTLGEGARERMLPLTWASHVSKWEELFDQLRIPDVA